MSKNLSKDKDLYAGLNKLKKDHSDRKSNNVGTTIIDTHITPIYADKQQVMVKIEEIYPSPSKWNFYDKLSDDKKIELMQSIEENGLLYPIILWDIPYDKMEEQYTSEDFYTYKFKGNSYMCLAGHNRIDAYMKLYEATKDEKYLVIKSVIFNESELDDIQAKEIVVDTNYVQRVLNTKEIQMSILYKYDEVKNNKQQKGRTRDIVAEELGISSAKVEQYIALNKMIPEIKQMVYDDKLALTSILKISDKTPQTQQWIYDNYKDVLTNRLLNKIKPYMKQNHIDELFKRELESKIKTKKVSIDVPDSLVEEFKEMSYQWIYNKTHRQ